MYMYTYNVRVLYVYIPIIKRWQFLIELIGDLIIELFGLCVSLLCLLDLLVVGSRF